MDGQWRGGEFNPAHGPAGGIAEAETKPASWPNEVERGRDFFWTDRTERPTADTWEWRIPTLADAQATWDEAAGKVTAHRERMEEMRQEREGKERQAEQARKEAFAAQQEEASKKREGELRLNHFAAGGSEQTWEAEREGVLAADRQQRTLEGSAGSRSLVDIKQFA